MNTYEIVWEKIDGVSNAVVRFFEDGELSGSLYLTARYKPEVSEWHLLGEHDGQLFCDAPFVGYEEEAIQHLTTMAIAFYSGLTMSDYAPVA